MSSFIIILPGKLPLPEGVYPFNFGEMGGGVFTAQVKVVLPGIFDVKIGDVNGVPLQITWDATSVRIGLGFTTSV